MLALVIIGGFSAFYFESALFSSAMCEVSNSVTTADTVNENAAQISEDSECVDASVLSADVQSSLALGKVVYNVLLFEFSDCSNYFTQERIDEINSLFNDTTRNNVYSVHEYLDELSYGKVSVFANIYLYKDSFKKSRYDTRRKTYNEEYATYVNGMENATVCYEQYKATNAGSMVIFSTESPTDSSSRLWSHAFVGHQFVSIPDGKARVSTIVHEIMHNFGIGDMNNVNVTTKGEAPVGNSDIMSQTSFGPINTYMYNKSVLGWVKTSDYEDKYKTEIETITKNGNYTLYPTVNQSRNTKAFKFGMKQGDSNVYFMIEYRKPQISGLDKTKVLKEGVIVYRVNENYKHQGNNKKSFSTYETYAFRPVNNSYYSSDAEHFIYKDQVIGTLADSCWYLRYDDKSICKCIISNITINNNGTLSFDFQNLQNEDLVAGKVGKANAFINDVDVYVNGVYADTTSCRGYFVVTGVKNHDDISFVSKDGRYVFNFIAAKINTYDLNIKAIRENPCVSINVQGEYDNKSYSLYKFSDGNWKLVGTFLSNQVVVKYLEPKAEYKISGYAIDDYVFTVRSNMTIEIAQKKIKEDKTETGIFIVKDIFKVFKQIFPW